MRLRSQIDSQKRKCDDAEEKLRLLNVEETQQVQVILEQKKKEPKLAQALLEKKEKEAQQEAQLQKERRKKEAQREAQKEAKRRQKELFETSLAKLRQKEAQRQEVQLALEAQQKEKDAQREAQIKESRRRAHAQVIADLGPLPPEETISLWRSLPRGLNIISRTEPGIGIPKCGSRRTSPLPSAS